MGWVAKSASLAAALMLGASAFAAPLCSVGDAANVQWKGKWYPAHVSRVNETQTKCFIHYDGYENSWDEWVGADRYQSLAPSAPVAKYRTGQDVKILWKQKWYDGFIIERSGDKYKIHYDGYENSWDEWVGVDRLAPR